MTLYWRHLATTVREFLAGASDHAYILAPFIQEEALAEVLPSELPVTVVTSWRGDHLRSGASSLAAYDVCRRHGKAPFYIHPHIHLKVYARDLTRASGSLLLGSANITAPGLGLVPDDANREVLMVAEELSIPDRVEIQRVIAESRLVDDAIHRELKKWLEQCGHAEGNRLPPMPSVESGDRRAFLVTDLPLTDSPKRLWELAVGRADKVQWWEDDGVVHDLALFGGNLLGSEGEFMEGTRKRFRSHPFVSGFLDQIDSDGMYFGRIKEWIQRNCEDVPTPRRRELTATVQALLRWVVELEPQEFEMARPGYSECLKRASTNL